MIIKPVLVKDNPKIINYRLIYKKSLIWLSFTQNWRLYSLSSTKIERLKKVLFIYFVLLGINFIKKQLQKNKYTQPTNNDFRKTSAALSWQF